MRHSIFANTLCFLAWATGLGNFAMSAEGPVDFTDYNDSGLQLYDAKVQPSDAGYVLTGRLANNQAKVTLKNAQMRIFAQDCSKNDDGSIVCIEIAHQDLTIAAAIAPRTTSALKLTLHFKEAPGEVSGWLGWTVWVLSAERE